MNKKDFQAWALAQLRKHSVRHPDTYTEQELIDLNPAVPVGFIKQHIKNRDKTT
jgi:hypothetical protein